ncbi:MAG: TrkA family potassium uptake protein [Chloroflexi bacterium]|nr:MAG: TrkA family potassium uptake protein [Chloroflexota bacterium]
MNIIVVGCGRVGSELAYRLYERGHRVTVIDPVRASFDNLSPDFRGQTIEGEALNQDVLRRAGIAQADGLAAATNIDSVNAVVAHVASDVYHVPNVVVRNYDPHWRAVHETFGLHVVSSTSWGAQRMEEMLYQSEIHTVFSAGNGEVEIYEFGVPAAWNGARLADLIPDGPCTVAAVTRAGRAQLPADDTLLESGDVILLSATMEGILELRQRLARPKEA